ncbi:hypothetical protein ENUP19_0152G0004 [Entamoeba nuttalli]|uniref:Uncharacterized protein n=2 Tax=Entamoeba nuttalli TaxID=412467 RepID=K2H4Q1_ENTNP|nr:hypothetical protein ENU1_196700 [Entamoeba nuttalli P19]EKE37459.1 hypothetical protein ENU1_196700 [Entamoeba nuttalli P19]|eukprot:XP_008860203.1 hypothetical protein ENU1_196700 [Entamoeba nuttalli P19]
MNCIFFIFIVLNFVSAEESFFGPHQLREHTYSYDPIFENTFISFNYALVVFILPLVILFISLLFFCNVNGLFSGKGILSLLFIGSAIGFVGFVVYSWIYLSFFEMLAFGVVIVPVVLLLAYLVSA